MKNRNKTIQNIFPTVYLSSSTPASLDHIDLANFSFLLLLSDLSDKYYQAHSMNVEQARALMGALAKLHAHFWQRSDSQDMHRGGFWVLKRRLVYGELERANVTWNGVIERFTELLKLNLVNICNITSKLVTLAHVLDYFVENRCHTLIHGDAIG